MYDKIKHFLFTGNTQALSPSAKAALDREKQFRERKEEEDFGKLQVI